MGNPFYPDMPINDFIRHCFLAAHENGGAIDIDVPVAPAVVNAQHVLMVTTPEGEWSGCRVKMQFFLKPKE